MPELLDCTDWRSFRLFLSDLEDAELDHVHRQLLSEIATRRDCETDVTRLFFSSLQTGDLETAQQTIRRECQARVQDRAQARPVSRAEENTSTSQPLK